MSRFRAGQKAPFSATWGQFSDGDGQYAGPCFDRYVRKGLLFPDSREGYHFKCLWPEKGAEATPETSL